MPGADRQPLESVVRRAVCVLDPGQDNSALLAYARLIHEACDASVILVVVLRTGAPGFGEARHLPAVQEALRQLGAHLVEAVLENLPPELADSAAVVASGQDLPHVVRNLVRQYEADLVVLQYPEASTIADWLGAGPLMRIIELTQSSILVVEEAQPPQPPETAIYCYSGSEASREALGEATWLAKRLGWQPVEVAHASATTEEGEQALAALRSIEAPVPLTFEFVPMRPDQPVAAALQKHVAEREIPVVIALREALGGRMIPRSLIELRPKALLTLSPRAREG